MAPWAAAIRTSSADSGDAGVKGFSQTTENPFSRNTDAIAKWLSFGVATTTRSTPSGRALSASAIVG